MPVTQRNTCGVLVDSKAWQGNSAVHTARKFDEMLVGDLMLQVTLDAHVIFAANMGSTKGLQVPGTTQAGGIRKA